ncbi:MAG: hypothetical protein A2Z25_22380 [Planctomycetes bacterium RBG_16_55_9]|nr:MAG: hypothetical protein A2Z25_22380 [Planctomycetes bacterium RBG_16_55_9]
MTMLIKRAILIVLLSVLPYGRTAQAEICFVESGDAWGLAELLKGIMSHAAACGDIDGDEDLDLYVGNFCDRPADRYLGRAGPVPNVLLINQAGKYEESGQRQVALQARTSGAVFADLDNDGDLDLYVSNNSKSEGFRMANKLFENRNGRFNEVSAESDACAVMGGRSIGVLDYDGDGLLDLLVAEDKWTGGRTRLLRNVGHLRFEDVSARIGLPSDLPGLGVITPDLNEDGRPDIFVSQANRLFLSHSDATYSPADSSVFQYEPINREAAPCGVAFGDLNRDGRMDIVIVDHSQPARQHLYINLGLRNGTPRFKDVTGPAGLDYRFPSWTAQKVHLKHAHVEICDFDNDGWPDILVAAIFRQANQIQPFVCRNVTASRPAAQEAEITVPRFAVPPVDKAEAYFAAGPVADYDRDGRLDVFLASWLPQMRSKLFLNRDGSNHWLRLRIVGRTINRMGIGAKIRIYRTGELSRADGLIGFQEIGTGFGFCSGQEAIAHFGLGEVTSCDVEITLPHGKGILRRTHVEADQVLVEYEPVALTMDY